MKKNHNKYFRVFAVSLSANGFGYAVMEDNALVEYRNKVFLTDKNTNSLTNIDKLIGRYQPDVLVLHDVNAKGTYRASRIKELHRKVIALAKKHKLKVEKFSNTELRTMLLNNPKGTKHDMAERIVKQFSDELASRVPPKRRDWTSEYARMDIFDAVALAVVIRMRESGKI
jgi:Holliday junction resolvasome RuvABC endonuclease subunit